MVAGGRAGFWGRRPPATLWQPFGLTKPECPSFQSKRDACLTTRHPMKLKTFLLTALLAMVYMLHQDFWNWKEAYPLIFGFLPIGLAYRSEEHTSELQSLRHLVCRLLLE